MTMKAPIIFKLSCMFKFIVINYIVLDDKYRSVCYPILFIFLNKILFK